jgi:beta-glucosidase
VFENLIKAHKHAYHAIKQVRPSAQIGLAKNNVYYEAYRKNNFLDRAAVWVADRIGNHYFLKKIKNETDFIGLNYYFYSLLKFDFPNNFQEMNFNLNVNRPDDPPEIQRSDMGWRTFPEGIFHVLSDLKKYNKPIFITENGIANATDNMRQDFIRQHLEWANKAMKEGADVHGYFYWSLTDNYEWDSGFSPRFGLVEINYETQERKIRPSASVFKEVVS